MLPNKKITLIGSGNVATVLGKTLQAKGYQIVEVYSRNAEHGVYLANILRATLVTNLSELSMEADIYILAVSDDALASVAEKLSLKDKLVIHTAGSVSKKILENTSNRYGVLWPMKMIRKSMQTISPVTIAIDGSSLAVIEEIEELAAVFTDKIIRADDTVRLKMHLLASLTANFSNHLYHLAADYCEAEGIPFDYFNSIIEETAKQIQTSHPKSVQAGPAFRGDKLTVERHLNLLENYPKIAEVYKVMTESIELHNKV